MSGRAGRVYLDFPGVSLYAKMPEEQVDWSLSGRPLLNARPLGDPKEIERLVEALAKAEQAITLSGRGVIWSRAWEELEALIERAGIPFYTTPQGRGVLPDDHPYAYLAMRSTAFREADLILIVGTRMNYIITHAAAPRFNANATIARIDIDADELASAPRKIDIPIVGDCKMVLQQIVAALDGSATSERLQSWRRKLARGESPHPPAPRPHHPPPPPPTPPPPP